MYSKIIWAERGDRCNDAGCEPMRGCNCCRLYRCWGCRKICGWHDGGTDTELCDACWCQREEEREQLECTFTV